MKRMVQKPLIIGIAGSSCSGKTSISINLSKKLKVNPPALTLDSYYRDFSTLTPIQRDEINFDIPDSLDHELMLEHINMLIRGKPIKKPVYDYTTHLRKGTTILSPSGKFLIVEGLYALYWENIRELFNLKVFVELKDSIGFNRRIERDIRERGSSLEYVISQYKTMVKPMFDKYILQTKNHADLILDGTAPVEESAETIVSAINKMTIQNE